jgi:hypothetical protein
MDLNEDAAATTTTIRIKTEVAATRQPNQQTSGEERKDRVREQ